MQATRIARGWRRGDRGGKNKGPDFRPALVVTRFIRLHPGAQKGSAANLEGRCSHRTASKTSMPTLNEQRNPQTLRDIRCLSRSFVQIIFSQPCHHNTTAQLLRKLARISAPRKARRGFFRPAGRARLLRQERKAPGPSGLLQRPYWRMARCHQGAKVSLGRSQARRCSQSTVSASLKTWIF